MDDKLIQNCLSTTLANTITTWKEAVWQNHFFASLYRLLPTGYLADPEFTAGQGRVDYRIHGEQFMGSVEWLISEFKYSTTQNVKDYILEHYYRFVQDPKGRFSRKYTLLRDEPFVVVNVTHKKPDVTIDGYLPQTYIDLVVDDNFQDISLYIDNHQIKLVPGYPVKYDFASRKTEPFNIAIYSPIKKISGIFFEYFEIIIS